MAGSSAESTVPVRLDTVTAPFDAQGTVTLSVRGLASGL